jgi:hypothetical protein
MIWEDTGMDQKPLRNVLYTSHYTIGPSIFTNDINDVHQGISLSF